MGLDHTFLSHNMALTTNDPMIQTFLIIVYNTSILFTYGSRGL